MMLDDTAQMNLGFYRQLMSLLLSKFRPIRYPEFKPGQSSKILVRHDVDHSPDGALDLSRVEAGLGIRATYFWNLNSDFYNLLEPKNIKIVNHILDDGHDIGIHLDSSAFNIKNESDLVEALILNSSIFEKFFDAKILAFSFHNPTERDLLFDEHLYGDRFINSYSKRIFSDFHYVSDSNGYWRYGSVIQQLEQRKIINLHFLTHPVWWASVNQQPRHKILECLANRSAACLRRYDSQFEENDRLNIGCVPFSRLLDNLSVIDRLIFEYGWIQRDFHVCVAILKRNGMLFGVIDSFSSDPYDPLVCNNVVQNDFEALVYLERLYEETNKSIVDRGSESI